MPQGWQVPETVPREHSRWYGPVLEDRAGCSLRGWLGGKEPGWVPLPFGFGPTSTLELGLKLSPHLQVAQAPSDSLQATHMGTGPTYEGSPESYQLEFLMGSLFVV